MEPCAPVGLRLKSWRGTAGGTERRFMDVMLVAIGRRMQRVEGVKYMQKIGQGCPERKR